MGDVEMTSLRAATGQPTSSSQQQPPLLTQQRHQQFYAPTTTNGFRKDHRRRTSKDDGQELIDRHRRGDAIEDYDVEDDEDEEDDVIAVRNRRELMEMREFRKPLEISTIGRQPQSGIATSSMCHLPSQFRRTLEREQRADSAEFPEPPAGIDSDFVDLLTGGDSEPPSPRPSRSQVLHYFARANAFTLRRVERDMQITDQDGFPLFDAYMEADCCGRTWTVEAYGRAVLIMREPVNGWCQDLARPRINVRDWNGDFFGLLLPGDPFYLHGSENKSVAKMIPHRTANGTGPGGMITSDDSSALSIDPAVAPSIVGAPVATVTPASLATAAGSRSVPSSKCWLCVHEGSGRHIARLEDFQTIQFNKDVAFQLKLLTLAGLVRLCGQSQITRTTNCVGVVKTMLNCCAGY